MADADPRAPTRWTRRPLFSPSQMLTAEQLNLMMDEERTRTQQLMRGLHGHGVIFGLAVTREEGPTPLRVSCGMALDPHGRLLCWAGGAVTLVEMPDCEETFTLSIHYARREVPGGGCGPCSDQPQWIEEGVIYSLRHECAELDRACVRSSEACCIGLDEYVCLRNGSREGLLPPAADLQWGCGAPGALTRVGCSDIFYDAGAGIPIACVEVRNLCENPACKPHWGFGEVRETCEVRPWVYRTPLLYELVKGCQNDLARVESVRWGPETTSSSDGWPDEVPWDVFAQALREGPEIAFSKDVRADTVHPGSVFLTAILWERQADYMLTRRIPASLQPLEVDDGYATQFRLRVNSDWIRNEIETRSELKSGGRVELTIRGQMVLDRCKNMLDAVPLSYEPNTPPHSRPGGDFVALLRFAAETLAPSPPPEPEREASPSDEAF
ncbi:MAG TPA: hypothetical protein VK614_12525 [Allosphingosinicella sp.]|nr:hypothetical protein [Allosphingosinicella sp.]